MPNSEFLTGQLRDLSQQIDRAGMAERLKLRPQLDKMIRRARTEGTAVPARVLMLHERLLDEAMEEQFDNMPI